MTRKIYTFCDLNPPPPDEQYSISNHPIIALDDTGEVVGHWVSSDHSFRKTDILCSLKEIDYPYDIEWVDDPAHHPIVSKLLT